MKKIVKIMVILIVIVLVLLLCILILKRNTGIEDETDELNEIVPEKNSNGFQKVTDANVFYSIQDFMNTFIKIYQLDIESNTKLDDEEKQRLTVTLDKNDINIYEIVEETQRKDILYSLLDKRYIDRYNITEENVMDYIVQEEGKINLIPIEMTVRYNTNLKIYLYHCYVEDSEKCEIVNDKYFIIRTDNKNYTIEPIREEQYDNIDEVKVDEQEGIIEKNDYNKFSIEMISVAQSAQKYMEHYRYLSTYYPELAYEYLDEEYREKRFGNMDNYKKYINKNIEELSRMQIRRYFSEYNEDGINQYVCKDQYENIYIFNEESVLKYALILDTYTLEYEEFTKKYKESDDQYRVMMNIDKWFQMLNNRDYESAFKVLDETFRNNYFNGKVDDFERFMREKYPSHYEVEYMDFSKQPGEIYSQKIGLKETIKINAEVDKVFSIIMKLEDNMEFTMSFSIEE